MPRTAPIAALVAGALAAGAAGCGKRQVAYHFRAPLVRSVSAPPLERALRPDDPPPSAPAIARRHHRRAAPPEGPPPPRPVRLAIPSEPLRRAGPADDLATRLRDLVGARDEERSHVAFALAALASLGVRLDPQLAAVADGPALVELAEARGALIRGGPSEGITEPPRLGDLLVFDRTTGADRASQIAVAVSVDDRGVVEFVYLARGVVRRGCLSLARPREKRDEHGRVLNTHLRANDGRDPRGTPSLAGELFAATIRLARLLR